MRRNLLATQTFSFRKSCWLIKWELCPLTCLMTSLVDFCGFNKNQQCTWSGIPLIILSVDFCSLNSSIINWNTSCSISGFINGFISFVDHTACIHILPNVCDIIKEIDSTKIMDLNGLWKRLFEFRSHHKFFFNTFSHLQSHHTVEIYAEFTEVRCALVILNDYLFYYSTPYFDEWSLSLPKCSAQIFNGVVFFVTLQ